MLGKSSAHSGCSVCSEGLRGRKHRLFGHRVLGMLEVSRATPRVFGFLILGALGTSHSAHSGCRTRRAQDASTHSGCHTQHTRDTILDPLRMPRHTWDYAHMVFGRSGWCLGSMVRSSDARPEYFGCSSCRCSGSAHDARDYAHMVLERSGWCSGSVVRSLDARPKYSGCLCCCCSGSEHGAREIWMVLGECGLEIGSSTRVLGLP